MGSLELSQPTTGSHFSSLPEVETDEVFKLLGAYRADAFPQRVNLGAGVYCDDEGHSWPLNVVGQVERSIHELPGSRRHDYLPIEGDPQFLKVARDLVFRPPSEKDDFSTSAEEIESRTVSVQTLSGTGANHLGARFLAETIRPRRVWLSNPTWANHHAIWSAVGVAQKLYPYYNSSTLSLDFDGMMTTLEREAQHHDVIVLHACAHNPTGVDPSQEQWMAIAELCQRKGIFPFFDTAYQGFASGDPARDAWAIRYFYHLQPSQEMCVAQSFSKSFGLYGQRTGAFHLIVKDPSQSMASRILGGLSNMIRSEYSVPPRYGSDIVRIILESEDLTQKWLEDLRIISGRIRDMRVALYDELCRLQTPGSWEQIIQQVGMFSYTGLTSEEVTVLRTKFHIYMLSSGRISIAGLNTKNVRYVAQAIHSVRTL